MDSRQNDGRRPRPVGDLLKTAPMEQLLRSDLLSRNRPASQFGVGPLADLPLAGSPIKVDPRPMRK